MLICPAMERMTPDVRRALIHVIATREGTAAQIADWYGTTPAFLKTFVQENHAAIEAEARRQTVPEDAATVSPADLDSLWITKKVERLTRLQTIADATYEGIQNGTFHSGADMAMAVREFRSYLMLAANELGQLLHRGSGENADGDTLSVNIAGVDMENLR